MTLKKSMNLKDHEGAREAFGRPPFLEFSIAVGDLSNGLSVITGAVLELVLPV